MNDFSNDTLYGAGILSGPIDGPARVAAAFPVIEANIGLMVLHRASSFRGSVVRIEHDGGLILKSPSSGLERIFRMTPGAFAVNGETVSLAAPKAAATTVARTSSGSRAVPRVSASIAKASRIWVEGVHDAELVEKVWGDDLRHEGIVVERLDGIDDLAADIAAFGPTTNARLGVLVDHLVPDSKESRIAESVRCSFVEITGTPFIDVWQAIRPQTLGISAWPTIPKGRDWKAGIAEFFGAVENGQPQTGQLWRRLLGRVTTYADLEPTFVGAVETLIDFVTTDAAR